VHEDLAVSDVMTSLMIRAFATIESTITGCEGLLTSIVYTNPPPPIVAR